MDVPVVSPSRNIELTSGVLPAVGEVFYVVAPEFEYRYRF
jgi:hypothetical protein